MDRKFILLLRGINVGGRNKLRMAELKELLRSFGLKKINTYIQSGNVVFESVEKPDDKLVYQIANNIESGYGFRPRLFLLTAGQLKRAMRSNPFPNAVAEPKRLHLFFLDEKPINPDLSKLNAIKKDSERIELKGEVFYLHAPDGIGRSKLASKVENLLGVKATARNWRTIQKLHEMSENT